MTLFIGKYKITSFAGGYKVSRKKGKQFKIMSYHQSLDESLRELFELNVRVETKDFVIDFNDSLRFDSQSVALIRRIDEMKSEILREVKDVR
jgi:hypothetical protein